MGTEYQHIGKAERLEISILVDKGYSLRAIAKQLGRSHSSLSREIANRSVLLNANHKTYEPHAAHHKAYVKRKYSKYQGMKIRENKPLEEYVCQKLCLDWSPSEISGRLRVVDTHIPYVSDEGIYKYLYSPYNQRLCQHLRSQKYRRKRRSATPKPVRELIKNRTLITERPEIINKRARIGDFEVDRIESGRRTGSKSGLVVVQDRASRYYQAIKTSSRAVQENTEAILQAVRAITVVHSLTYDNDISFRDHGGINQELQSSSYFCLPHHPWEKGGIEYQNRLMRQYIKKGSDINQFSQEDINHFLELLNNRPRKCLNYRTPTEVMLANHAFKEPY